MPRTGMKLAKGNYKTFTTRVAVFQPSLFDDGHSEIVQSHLIKENSPREARAIQELNALITAQYKMSDMGKRLFVEILDKLPGTYQEENQIQLTLEARSILEASKLPGEQAVGELEKTLAGLIRHVCWIEASEGPVLVGLISSGAYKNVSNLIRVQIDPVLYPYYQKIKETFDTQELTSLIQFKSFYSKRIYDLFSRIHTSERTFFYHLNELKRQLLIEPDEYKRYSDLQRFVLAKAQTDLATTPLAFSFHEKRNGKNQVLGVEFQLTAFYQMPM